MRATAEQRIGFVPAGRLFPLGACGLGSALLHALSLLLLFWLIEHGIHPDRAEPAAVEIVFLAASAPATTLETAPQPAAIPHVADTPPPDASIPPDRSAAADPPIEPTTVQPEPPADAATAQPDAPAPPPAPTVHATTVHATTAQSEPPRVPPARPKAPRPIPTPHAATPTPPPAAPPVAAGGTEATAAAPAIDPGWQASVVAWIAAHKTYPSAAQRMGEEGRVEVRFTVDRLGRVMDAEIVVGSGSGRLDSAAVALLSSATLPAFPATMSRDRITLVTPIRYTLR